MRTLLAALAILLGASPALAANVTFNDFSSTAGLALNGHATTAGTGSDAVLRLTSATTSQSGSAFSQTTVSAATFSTYFQFQITGAGGYTDGTNSFQAGADGLVFVIQSVSANIGGAGGGIGYLGINNSVGVEFDTWLNPEQGDPSTNHVGIDTYGSVVSGVAANVPTRFDDGNIWHAWVDYNGTSLEVRVNQTGVRPGAALLSQDLNVGAIIGNNSQAYIGFTSGTGAGYGNHDILYWEYRDTFAPIAGVPEPTTLGLLAAGGLGLIARRKRSA